jgi:hypothetical protein
MIQDISHAAICLFLSPVLKDRQRINLTPAHSKFDPEEETKMVYVNVKKLVNGENLESG